MNRAILSPWRYYVKLTPGKLAGMKAVSNDRGVIAAAAMDQRGSLKKSLAAASGSETPNSRVQDPRRRSPHPACQRHPARSRVGHSPRPSAAPRARACCWPTRRPVTTATPGRLPDLLDVWSAHGSKEAGADCLKILLYYTPFDTRSINDLKHAWVERIGDECRANDIPFFLEFVGYEDGIDEKGARYAKQKPAIVTGSMAEFSKDRYGVDVLKVEIPVNMRFVEGLALQRNGRVHAQGSPGALS